MPRRLRSDDSGFTLLEVISTCILLAVLVGMAVGPWSSYRHARAHVESRNELVAALRNAQVSSVAENVTYRVDLTATTATSYRLPPSGGQVRTRQYLVEDTNVTFANAAFETPSGTGTSVFFYPRGSASKGDVQVLRSGRSKVYTVSVEGLTARVSYSD